MEIKRRQRINLFPRTVQHNGIDYRIRFLDFFNAVWIRSIDTWERQVDEPLYIDFYQAQGKAEKNAFTLQDLFDTGRTEEFKRATEALQEARRNVGNYAQIFTTKTTTK